MECSYDIFEVLPNEVLLWKATVTGRETAIRKLHELAESSPNEFRLMHLPTNVVIFTLNSPQSSTARRTELNRDGELWKNLIER